jgi:uncharacterized OsmC-like protein
MDAAALRALQAPLKQAYRDDPATALIAAHAEGQIDQARIACSVGAATAGLHPAAGGDGSLTCSADMLLEALVACAGVTLAAVATAMGVALRSGRVVADGTWDARGTLAIDKAAPIGITDIALRFEIESDADTATIERLIATTERYCVILKTLRVPPKISTELIRTNG